MATDNRRWDVSWLLASVFSLPRSRRPVVSDGQHRGRDRSEGARLQLLRLLHDDQLHRQRRDNSFWLLDRHAVMLAQIASGEVEGTRSVRRGRLCCRTRAQALHPDGEAAVDTVVYVLQRRLGDAHVDGLLLDD